MKRIGFICIFIFLTGLFSGLFFSTNLSYENNSYLSSLLFSSFSETGTSFSGRFISSLFSNLLLVMLMLPALLTKYFCPLPPAILWYKSFAIGFCSGLVYINGASDAFVFSLVKIFPQNIFLIPGFILLASVLFFSSLSGAFSPASLSSSSRFAAGRSPSRSRSAGFRTPSSRFRFTGPSMHKKNRAHSQNRILFYGIAISIAFIVIGCFTEAIFRLIAL